MINIFFLHYRNTMVINNDIKSTVGTTSLLMELNTSHFTIKGIRG
ncbi:hypothetical protein MATR_21230 [Marivirga tractuosa]|nr:hypothetical protein MATR_21230 [Marivirga tractuosa]